MSGGPRPATVVAVLWLTLAAGYGLFLSFSVFFVALVEEFRWSRALTAGALSVSTVVQGVLAPVVGALVDRFGPRPVIIGGVALVGVAAMLGSTITAPWQLYLYTGVVGAVGLTGLGWVPSGVLLSRWFSERRGRMLGVAFSGMGVGVFVMGPLAQWLIATFGWRAASAALGAGVLLAVLPAVWIGARDPGAAAGRSAVAARPGRADDAGVGRRPRVTASRGDAPGAPPHASAGPMLADALRSRVFWALFLAYFFTPLAVFPIATHQVAFAVDLGFAPLFAASIFGLMGLLSSAGRAAFGVAADRLGGPVAATLSFACSGGGALALLVLEASPHAGWLVVYAILFGLGFGARGPIITAMAAERFGGRRFGVIYGALNLGNGLGGAFGPWFGGFVHDITGSYRVVFVASVVFCALASACFWLARWPALTPPNARC